jgi:ribosomal-protein-alanine N-acetyltransferase
MTPAHLDRVVALEETLFPEGPWTREMFRQELEDSFMSRPMVAFAGDELVGYMATWFLRDEVHLLNIGVSGPCQRRGYGRRMVEHLIEQALAGRRAVVSLEVRAGNEAARALYRSLCFREVAVRRRYYESGEDAVVMVLDLPGADAPLGGNG